MLKKIKLIGITCALLLSITGCGTSEPFSPTEFLESVATIVKDDVAEAGTLIAEDEVKTFKEFSGEIDRIVADLDESKDTIIENFDNDEVKYEEFKKYFVEYGKLVKFIGDVKSEDVKINYYGSKVEGTESISYGVVTYEFAETVDLTTLKEVDFKFINDYYNNKENFNIAEGEGIYYELKGNVLINLVGKYYANINEIKALMK